uniref:Uncharacterized protein n=1 Tax=Anguilla anguilla TaxID=7936 RepID=A0A0E9UKP8_ANGAN
MKKKVRDTEVDTVGATFVSIVRTEMYLLIFFPLSRGYEPDE